MASVEIPCSYVRGIDPVRINGCFVMRIDCNMTNAQMFECLQSMLARITGAEWAEWCARIDEEAEPTDAADSLAARETA